MENNSKICTGCKQNKLFSSFTSAKLGKFGLRAKCKTCRAKEAVEHNLANKEKVSARGKKYRQEKKDQISAQRATHTAKNKKRLYGYALEYRKANPGKINAKTAKRRAMKKQRTPKWLTAEHYKIIEAVYVEAVRLTNETGIPHEVDHIVPLQGKVVSGLHVPWNLRIILQSENRHKSRKFPLNS